MHGLRAAAGAGVACIAVPTDMTRHHDFRDAMAVLDGMPAVIPYLQERKALRLAS